MVGRSCKIEPVSNLKAHLTETISIDCTGAFDSIMFEIADMAMEHSQKTQWGQAGPIHLTSGLCTWIFSKAGRCKQNCRVRRHRGFQKEGVFKGEFYHLLFGWQKIMSVFALESAELNHNVRMSGKIAPINDCVTPTKMISRKRVQNFECLKVTKHSLCCYSIFDGYKLWLGLTHYQRKKTSCRATIIGT